jgi:hypothetical protein
MEKTMFHAVFGIARTHVQVERVLGRLSTFAMAKEKVSVLFRHREAVGEPASPVLARSAGASGRTAERLDWLEDIRFFAFPGIGFFLATGPLKAALARTTNTDLPSILEHMGVWEHEAGQLQDDIRGGNILLSFHSGDSLETKIALMIFLQAGADKIALAGELPLIPIWPETKTDHDSDQPWHDNEP